MRLQKYLASAGIASRRKAEEYILEGRVEINGQKVTMLGTLVEDGDIVKCDNKIVELKNEWVYYILNKPVGYVTTASDEKNRPTVIDLMKQVEERIFPVGRLDYNTSGLLILTNDGELTYTLTHPKHEVPKTYHVKVKGIVTKRGIQQLKNGIMLDGRKTAQAEVVILNTTKTTTKLSITIHEGRNRQVRRMCNAIGHDVLELNRISVGELKLGDLKIGEYRMLTSKEISYLKQ